MFNVTILKMKDIIKYVIGITMTIMIIIVISKTFSKNKINSNEKEKIVNEVKNGINMLSEKSLTSCFEQTVPVMANFNEEYNKIAKEDDHSKEELLHGFLKTQISSIKGLEDIENSNKEITENDKAQKTNGKAQTESNEEIQKNTQEQNSRNS